eukprot:TRINITY_DN5526_c0_g1_i1.p1 TRINITY_DN5526_c0_g1~~TRINITY_DN5526_c0_g1_i1.p1  ORF type:complete len:324 (-),score=73.96 TRINITY_DN5526_c0_g1_i1:13-879(-)
MSEEKQQEKITVRFFISKTPTEELSWDSCRTTGDIDAYHGLHIKPSLLPEDPAHFFTLLQKTLDDAKKEALRSIWIRIPKQKNQLISVAIEAGFKMYTVDREEQSLILTIWLDPNHPDRLPNPATHTVGVAGFVLNEKNEILVVKERTGAAVGFWKFPGGRVDPGEDLTVAVCREVLEETGIKAEFISCLGFRENHGELLGWSDMFFLCALKPLTSEITIQPHEIAEAQWMPLKDFLALPFYKGLYKNFLTLCDLHSQGIYQGFDCKRFPLVFKEGTNALYFSPQASL